MTLNHYVVKAVTEIREMQWGLRNSLDKMQEAVRKGLEGKSEKEIESIVQAVANRIDRDIELHKQFLALADEAAKSDAEMPYPIQGRANKLVGLLTKVKNMLPDNIGSTEGLLSEWGLKEVKDLPNVDANKDKESKGWGSSYPNILAALYANILMELQSSEGDVKDMSIFNPKLPFIHPTPVYNVNSDGSFNSKIDTTNLEYSYLITSSDGKVYYTGFSCGFDWGGSRKDDALNGEYEHYDGSAFPAIITNSPVPFATVHLMQMYNNVKFADVVDEDKSEWVGQ